MLRLFLFCIIYTDIYTQHRTFLVSVCERVLWVIAKFAEVWQARVLDHRGRATHHDQHVIGWRRKMSLHHWSIHKSCAELPTWSINTRRQDREIKHFFFFFFSFFYNDMSAETSYHLSCLMNTYSSVNNYSVNSQMIHLLWVYLKQYLYIHYFKKG